MENKKRGKRMIPIPESPIYSKLIFEVLKGNNYAQKIYSSLKGKKEVSVILRQLQTLEKNKVVISRVEEDKSKFPMQKIRYYSVDLKTIGKFFANYLREDYSNLGNGLIKEASNKPQLIKEFHEGLTKYEDELGVKFLLLLGVLLGDNPWSTLNEAFKNTLRLSLETEDKDLAKYFKDILNYMSKQSDISNPQDFVYFSEKFISFLRDKYRYSLKLTLKFNFDFK